MDYFSLKCFVEVVRTGSFSKAAHKLFRSQPAVSLQIRKLEEELKQPLLDRYKKKIILTETGKTLYEQAKELMEKFDTLKLITSNASKEPKGPLTIATNLSLINNFLPPIIGQFHRKYPKVKVVLLNLKSNDMQARILEGNADIGVGYLLPHHEAISQKKIVDTDFVLVMPRNFGLKHDRPVPKDILDGPFVHFEKGVALREYIEHYLRPLSITIELPSIESILNYVQNGLGCSILPTFSITQHWKNILSIKQLSNVIPPMTIYVYKHQKRIPSKTTESFLKILGL